MDKGKVALKNTERTVKDAKMYKKKQKNVLTPREGPEGGRGDHHCHCQKYQMFGELL